MTGAVGRRISPPSLAAANYQHAVNHPVSGVRVQSEIAPAVTELRRPRASTATGHQPVASHQPPL